MRRFQLPLLGSSRRPPKVNQDSPDPEFSPAWAGISDNLLGNGHYPSIRARFPAGVLPAHARRNYGKTTACPGLARRLGYCRAQRPLESGQLVAASGEDGAGGPTRAGSTPAVRISVSSAKPVGVEDEQE
jgi:hypothetical protein